MSEATEREERCPCGERLHYTNDELRAHVDQLVELYGPTVRVGVLGRGEWRVPRHFIALHGLNAVDLPALAERMGFDRA